MNNAEEVVATPAFGAKTVGHHAKLVVQAISKCAQGICPFRGAFSIIYQMITATVINMRDGKNNLYD